MIKKTGWVLVCFAALAQAESIDPKLYSALQWRHIGPFRGGRTVACAGIPSEPNVFYIAANNGGVWKTTDYGHTWQPLFDSQPTGSIGALAIAASNANVIYVGSGEGLQRPDLSVGDGVYKSTDGGLTWSHLGLNGVQQISSIAVHPRDPNRVFVSVLGHPYGPNEDRGVFRSTDGGATWQKVLYKNENTGAMDIEFDPSNPNRIYVDLWAARQGPWENGQFQGPESGLFVSDDAGDHWRQLTKGLPSADKDGLSRIGFAIAPNDSKRMYAWVNAPRLGGIYRSDDAGESWTRVNSEQRVWGRGDDFGRLAVDPTNKDILYVANTSTYRSMDAGVNFRAIKGAPGGDDYHTIWINPLNRQIILIASDQGATITVNGGETWSSWYNQPTAQFYHVITDNRWPYWVYGGQQESGSAGVASRGDNGAITFRDWHPVGVEEYGYVAPDPLNPNLIYGGKATRYDMVTGQTQNIAPTALRGGKYRSVRTMPILFSDVDKHVLYLASNVLFKTTNGGQSWDVISPDLSREQYDIPPSVGVYTEDAKKQATRRGVIYAVAPSHKSVNTIWAGTDDGLIHITRDGGKTWKDITPPALTPWSKVSQLDAGHSDDQTVYAAVNRIRLDDMKPHIWRTHDGGKTWTEIVKGLPGDPINTVREDPIRKGLLFAGSERAVYVSFNDGDDWLPLRLNMPATSIRDLVIHNDDVVVGTHGRGFWILDDISPLRQMSGSEANAAAFLFKPQTAIRVQRNVNTDTPLPPEEPAGQNPPDGAILYYWLSADTPDGVTLEINDAAGKLIRRYSSNDKPEVTLGELEKELNVPTHWVRLPKILPNTAGMHRWIWDLRNAPPPALSHEYPISAIDHDTPRLPLGVSVMPGTYTVKLTAGGKTTEQKITVKMDPRLKTPQTGLQQQYDLSMRVYRAMEKDASALEEAKQLGDAGKELAGTGGGRRFAGGSGPSLSRLNGELSGLLELLQGADATPTKQAAEAVAELEKSLDGLVKKLAELKK